MVHQRVRWVTHLPASRLLLFQTSGLLIGFPVFCVTIREICGGTRATKATNNPAKCHSAARFGSGSVAYAAPIKATNTHELPRHHRFSGESVRRSSEDGVMVHLPPNNAIPQ